MHRSTDHRSTDHRSTDHSMTCSTTSHIHTWFAEDLEQEVGRLHRNHHDLLHQQICSHTLQWLELLCK